MKIEKKFENISIYSNENFLDHDDIKRKYIDFGIEEFIKEAKKIIGSWVIFDHQNKFLLTSVSFTGGYFDTKNQIFNFSISELLKNKKDSKNFLNSKILFSEIYSNIGYGVFSTPKSTIFKDIIIIGAGVYFYLKNTLEIKSYIQENEEKKIDYLNFENAMFETSEIMFKRFSNINFLFSGGVDSLSIFLALQKVFGRERLSATYIDQYITGGSLQQSRAVAKEYGIELNVVEPKGGWAFGSEEKYSDLDTLLRKNIVHAISPFHSLGNQTEQILDGQNMDALMMFRSRKGPQLSNQFKLTNLKHDVVRILKNLPNLNNFHERFFLKNSYFSLGLLVNFIQNKRKKDQILRDDLLLSSHDSNEFNVRLMNAYSIHNDYIDCYLNDYSSIKKYFNKNNPNLREIFFYFFPLMNNLLCSSASSLNGGVIRFVNQNPFLKLWLSSIKGKDILNPKWQILKFINKISKKVPNISIEKDDREKRIKFNGYYIEKNISIIASKKSILLEKLDLNEQDHYIKLISKLKNSLLEKSDLKMNYAKSLRIINYEKLLENDYLI